MNINAVIFDMDGVLVDSTHHWEIITHQFLINSVPGWKPEMISDVTGLNLDDMYQKLVEWGTAISREQFMEFCNHAACEVYQKQVALTPGTKQLLEELSKKHKLALASAAPKIWVDMVLQRFSLQKFFDVVITADDVKNCKPAPDIFLLAASRLGVAPSSCVVIEDSLNGISAAKAAEMRCIAVTGTFPGDRLSHADNVVDNLAQIAV